MKFLALFPNEDSFYPRMGIDVFENYDEMKRVYAKFKLRRIDLESTLLYETKSILWNRETKRIATLATSIGFFNTLIKQCDLKFDMLSGVGIGLVSALTCAQSISIGTAVRFIRTEKCSIFGIHVPVTPVIYKNIELDTKEKIVQALQECLNDSGTNLLNILLQTEDIHKILEIGPNCLLTKSVLEGYPDYICAHFDRQNNGSISLDNLGQKKYANKLFAMKRILGNISATKNNNNDESSGSLIMKEYQDVQTNINQLEMKESRTEEEMNYSLSECIKHLKNNFTIKLTPEEEVRKRIRMIENETLIELMGGCGY